jgi:hypothetical protein
MSKERYGSNPPKKKKKKQERRCMKIACKTKEGKKKMGGIK